MSICPFAIQQIIPESHTQGRINPSTLILHRQVSSAESLYNYWNTPGVEVESHFSIGQFGALYQFMDTNVRADANVDANGFAISVESWDGGNTPDDMPWNSAQLTTLKRLTAWVRDEHGIAPRAATTWNGGGIGGHNWFPYPWAGGPRGCPGTARNAQIRNDIIPFAANGGGWQGEEDMTPEEHNLLVEVRNLAKEIRSRAASIHTKGFREVGLGEARALGGDLGWVQEQLKPVYTKLDQLSAKVDTVSTGGVDLAALVESIAARVDAKLAARLAD